MFLPWEQVSRFVAVDGRLLRREGRRSVWYRTSIDRTDARGKESDTLFVVFFLQFPESGEVSNALSSFSHPGLPSSHSRELRQKEGRKKERPATISQSGVLVLVVGYPVLPDPGVVLVASPPTLEAGSHFSLVFTSAHGHA